MLYTEEDATDHHLIIIIESLCLWTSANWFYWDIGQPASLLLVVSGYRVLSKRDVENVMLVHLVGERDH